MRCPTCAELNDYTARFCYNCGTNLETANSTNLFSEPQITSVEPTINSFHSTLSRTLASRENRLIAQLIDLAIMGITILPAIPFILGTIACIINRNWGEATATTLFGILISIVLVIALTTYQLIILSNSGQTIGKKVMKIKIIMSGSGENPGFIYSVLIRSLLPAVINSFIIGIFTLIDILFIFRVDKRCIHDLLADTDVVDI